MSVSLDVKFCTDVCFLDHRRKDFCVIITYPPDRNKNGIFRKFVKCDTETGYEVVGANVKSMTGILFQALTFFYRGLRIK